MTNTNDNPRPVNPDQELSYEGIHEEATLVCALYHGTRPLGMGMLHNTPGLTVDDVRMELVNFREDDGTYYFDYYRGRPLKCQIDPTRKTVTYRLYDCDAGQGACARIISSVRGDA